MAPTLSNYFREEAAWRHSKADEYPEDRRRNKQCARALDLLANWLDRDGAEAARTLEPFIDRDSGRLGGEETQRAISRYGFGYNVTEAHHAEFVKDLEALCLEDSYAYATDNPGENPWEVLFDFELEAAERGVHLPRRYFELRPGRFEDELVREVIAYSA